MVLGIGREPFSNRSDCPVPRGGVSNQGAGQGFDAFGPPIGPWKARLKTRGRIGARSGSKKGRFFRQIGDGTIKPSGRFLYSALGRAKRR